MSRTRQLLRAAWGHRRYLAVTLASWLAAALILRSTWRDGLPVLATVHHASPLPVLTLAAAGLALLCVSLQRRRLSVAAALLGLGLAVAAARDLWGRESSARTGPASWRVMTWNAGRPDDLAGIVACMRSRRPDLAAFVEAGRASAAEWQRAFPGATARRLPGGMAVVTRGRLLGVTFHQLTEKDRCCRLRVELDGVEITVLVVDLHGSPFRSRAPGFQGLGRLVDAARGERLVVLGDLNTPHDSVHVEDLGTELTHAFQARGRGWAPTWPRPVPVLVLDHVLVGPGLRVVGCTVGGCGGSDHRAVLAEVAPAP